MQNYKLFGFFKDVPVGVHQISPKLPPSHLLGRHLAPICIHLR
jgi:hypothetical protein